MKNSMSCILAKISQEFEIIETTSDIDLFSSYVMQQFNTTQFSLLKEYTE